MDPMVLEELKLAKQRRIFVLVICSIVVMLALYWMSGFSFIEVSVSGRREGNFQYSFLDQNGGDPITTNTTAATVKKLVRRGNFEVIVRESDKSAFSVVSTKGFFRTTKVNLEIQKERGREFIGGNPSACMRLFNQRLVSYSCGGPYSKTILHVPATDKQPTYNQLTPTGRQGAIEGFIRVGGQDMVVIKNFFEISDENPAHAAYAVGDDLSLPLLGTSISGLRTDDLYTIIPYRDGFLAYNTKLTHIVYYPSVSDLPKTIEVEPPKDQSLAPYLLTTFGETVAVAYSASAESGQANLEDPKASAKETTVVVLQTGNNSRRLMFKGRYADMQACGPDKLCVLLGRRLQVYNISGNEPIKLFEITGVNEFLYAGETLLAVKDEGILGINTSTVSGSVQYSFGQYTYCGIQPSGSDYLLCVISPKQKKAALLVSQNNESDGIDQKIAKLLQLSEVRDVSPYKNIIFISPNAGQMLYQQSLGGYGYDPNTIKSANDKIDAEIDRVDIDRNHYQLINTLH